MGSPKLLTSKIGFHHDIDRSRGVAILIVVLSHAAGLSIETLAGRTVTLALSGVTWTFVFISGYLMAQLRDNYTNHLYLVNKIRTVIYPYILVVSLILLSRYLIREFLEMEMRDVEILDYYLLGYPAAGPLWFIPMIALFYIFFPVYKTLCQRPLTVLLLTALSFSYSILVGRPSVPDSIFHSFAYFQSAYLGGICYCLYRDRIDNVVSSLVPFMACVMVFGTVLSIVGIEENHQWQIFAMSPLTLILIHTMKYESFGSAFWRWLASRSFGIFLLHGPVLIIAQRSFGSDLNIVNALFAGVGIVVVSGGIVSTIRYVKFVASNLVNYIVRRQNIYLLGK